MNYFTSGEHTIEYNYVNSKILRFLPYPKILLHMNKLFSIICLSLLLISCESREDKIQKAVAQELKGVYMILKAMSQ